MHEVAVYLRRWHEPVKFLAEEFDAKLDPEIQGAQELSYKALDGRTIRMYLDPKGTRHETQEITRLLMLEAKDPEALDPEQTRYLERLRSSGPEIAAAQDLAGRFARLVRDGQEDDLKGWLREARESDLSEIVTFARGIRQDEAAVRAAISAPWSNGQVEGQVNRLKMLKRQMYGRANFDLLRRRVLGAA